MNLPEELIIKILLRLPVKSLVRFKCVCKSWLSLISDPQFAKSHFELASKHTHRLIYIAASDARSIDYEAPLHDDSAVANLNFPLDPPIYFVQIMGSCRGFLLLKNELNLFLWNPSTGFLKPLTLSRSCEISSNVNVVPTLYGFGFDPLTDDFLVVLGSYVPSAAGLVTHFEYLSLKTNSWKKVAGSELPYVNPIDEPGAGVLLNDAIHWIAFRLDEWVGVILAFDLEEKSLREVPMPGGIHFVFCDLVVLGGSLCLCYTGIDSVEIWLMKQYRVRSSWTKSIVLSVADILTNTFSPICFTKGGEIVGLDGCTGLVKFNHKGELLGQRDYSPDWPECKVAVCTETLLSLPPSIHQGEAGFSYT
ncbi:hypothetical protein L6164_025565 [Bauhinia variegata]|uniref:Uncharacterized protein n=1 Tax=Bauhinia variegata TaxID=167791 RepID=A0ACB9M2D0_BAUVA|nr:hypothetical protein L6164_025565 [Bauhinia variegata]